MADRELMTNAELRDHVRTLAKADLVDEEVNELMAVFEVEGLLEPHTLTDEGGNEVLDEMDEPVTTGRWWWSQDAGTNMIASEVISETLKAFRR